LGPAGSIAVALDGVERGRVPAAAAAALDLPLTPALDGVEDVGLMTPAIPPAAAAAALEGMRGTMTTSLLPCTSDNVW